MRWIAAVAVLSFHTAATAQDRQEFPGADPQTVGLSTPALQALDDIVKGYVEHDLVVGAELMVIKNRRTVWHTAHGVADREEHRTLEPGSIYCIRSMTKPFVGTAVQILLDDGTLHLDDPAARWLPSFDNETHRTITIQQLLEHRSGLPLSSLLATDHRSLASVQDVAALAGAAELEAAPGQRFIYSDDGADTLTAILERASGKHADEFIQARILDPLGMHDTIPVVRAGDDRRARIVSGYMGGPGNWVKFTSADQKPLFPYFLGSQAMYSSCADYARLLCLWADRGQVNGRRILSPAAIDRGLRPRSDSGFVSNFTNLRSWYAQLWQVWIAPPPLPPTPDKLDAAPGQVIAFGHGGSDGTAAFMWPKRDLIVLYFSQSRGGLTAATIEGEIDRLLIRGELTPPGPAPASAPDTAGLEGIYWNDERSEYWAITPGARRLHVEIEGQTAVDLVPTERPDEWRLEAGPILPARFKRNAAGRAESITVSPPLTPERTYTRLEPNPDLPTPKDIAARVRAAQGLASLRGVITRRGTIQGRNGAGPYVSRLSKDAVRADITLRGSTTRLLMKDGKVWKRQGAAPAEELTGPQAAAVRLDDPHILFGGWLDAGAQVRVLRRLEDDGKKLLMLRVVLPNAPGSTVFVEEATWRILRTDRLVEVAGLGTIGQETRYEYFEPIGGVLLPRVATGEFSVPQLGKTEVRFEKIELDEAAPGPGAIDDD